MTRVPKPRKPLPRQQKPIRRSKKAIRKVNPIAKAKRVVRYRKMLRSKEYLAAKAEAMARAGGQCELWLTWTSNSYDSYHPPFPIIYTGTVNATTTHMQRCAVSLDLQAHHKSYPKTRPVESRDLVICCRPHHEYLESLKLGKTRMF